MSDENLDPSNAVLQLMVSLVGISPAIWRRVLVPASITLPVLHWTFQELMGWANYHEHRFSFGDTTYGETSDGSDDDVLDEYDIKLAPLIGAGDPFTYEYDFGDAWEHLIEIESLQPVQTALRHPVCLAGARACPLEDVGGTARYETLLTVLADPSHSDHHNVTEWTGLGFDPELFNIELINAHLQRVR